MSRSRPFVPAVSVAAPADRLGDLAAWARQMTEAGVDGLALDGHPEDPVIPLLLDTLRRVTTLPLELHCPSGVHPAPQWIPLIAEMDLDWLVPAHPAPEDLRRALADRGVGVTWPASAGGADPGTPRVHAGTAPEDRAKLADVPAGYERSITIGREEVPAPPEAFGGDRLVLPGERLEGSDPEARLAAWRP